MGRNAGPAGPGGLVVVDKSGGMTSHDVVARMRRLAGTRRVGHAGTLDPMATGVLVLGVERATRLLGHLMLTEKTYEATIRLGTSTITDDAEGDSVAVTDASGLSEDAVRAELGHFVGDIQQVPSAVSAIKVNGQRSYARVRAGEQVELAARPVRVDRFTLNAFRTVGDQLDLDVAVDCSSGTYIRALARDLGARLGVGGHLTALRRTRVGPFTIGDAATLDELADSDQPVVRIPLSAAAGMTFPRLDVDAELADRVAHGGMIPASVAAGQADALAAGPVGVFAPDGQFIALVAAKSGRVQPLAVFVG